MELKYKSPSGMFEVNFEGRDMASVFEALSAFQEVFEQFAHGAVIAKKQVPAKDLRFSSREIDGNVFHEIKYAGDDKDLWGYRFSFGMKKEPKGALFPKYQIDEEKRNQYDNGGGGWFRYRGKDSGSTTTSEPPVDKPVDESGKAPF